MVRRAMVAAASTSMPFVQRTGVIEPLADNLQWDWRGLQRCALVCRAWLGPFSLVKDSLKARLAAALTQLYDAHAASPLAVDLQEQRRSILNETSMRDLAELRALKKPPVMCIENLCLALHMADMAQPPDSPLTRWLPDIGELSESNRSGWMLRYAKTANRVAYKRELIDRLIDVRVVDTPPSRLEDLRAWQHEPCTSRDVVGRCNRWCMLLAEWMQALLAEWELLRSVRVDAADAPMLLTVQAELAGAEARAEKERAARAARPAPEGKASAQAREDLRRGLRRSPEEVAVSDDLRAKLAIDVALKAVASRARRPADTTERTAVSLP